MSDLSNEVLNVLFKNGIKDVDIPTELFKIQNEIETTLWEKINISPIIFYRLKDTIFYNFEYLDSTDKITGKSSLKSYGSNYPAFMFNFNDGSYIERDYIPLLLNEIKDVKSKWNENIYTADLYSKGDFDWEVGEKNPSTLIIYNKDNESPSKYGYQSNSNYSNILGNDGNLIKDNVVLCSIYKMDMYREYNLLTETLINLYNIISLAEKNNKGIHLSFNEYNYEK